MNREILFRGKRVDNGKWIEGFYVAHSGRHEILVVYSNEILDYDLHPVLPETVGQFTGIPDKNGVKIFEGDIRKDRKYKGTPGEFMRFVGVVVFRHGKFMLEGINKYSGMHAELFGTGSNHGNIHDK
jgi:uncharacterized phage protein (TIGR01671 family)